MIWIFKKKDIRFETMDYIYLTKKDGATISFTKKGVIFKDLEKIKKETKK